jgi:hypothetical protein
MKTTITVLESRMVDFRNKVESINRKAKKFGFTEITYEIGNEFFKEFKDDSGKTFQTMFRYVDISGELPVINGWRVIGKMEHTENGVIAQVFTDDNISEFRNREKPHCDHCSTARIKRWSFIIKNMETNELMQVGKSCVKDYIPRDVNRAFNFLSYFAEVFESDWGHSSSYTAYYDVDDVIKASYYSITNHGFQSSNTEYPTALDVVNYFIKPNDDFAWDLSDEKFEEFVDSFYDFYTNHKEPNNFVQTINDLLNQGAIEYKFFSYIAGAVSSLVNVEKQVKEKLEFLDEYYGEIKTRYELEVALLSVHTFEGQYGWVNIHRFVDEAGHLFVWFANNTRLDAEDGDKVTIKGTVKLHDEYRENKQTVLTRVAKVK